MNPLTNPTAHAVDKVLIYIFGFSLLLLVSITLVMIWFVIRYRRSKNPEPTSEADGNLWLETVWTLLPTLIVLTMFWYGWTNYVGLRKVPAGAFEVRATGRMWSWQFEYENGRTSNKLYVPVGKPIKVVLNATDVLHSFFMPAFRIKRDTVPGIETYVWFQAPQAGSYDIFCAEYCGTGHADMITTAEILSAEDFERWYAESSTAAAGVARGRQLLEENGCLGCHSTDDSSSIGPNFKGLNGRTTEVKRDGEVLKLKVDAEYLRRAIREPNREIVEGYPAIMPPNDHLSDEEIEAIVQELLQK